MADRGARSRTGTQPRVRPVDIDPRIHVGLSHLLSLEAQARALSFLPRQPARSALNGRHTSRLRGRGLNFEEMRDYLPGDDVRAMDWKVTARTGTPHVRVMTEERDRPALIVVDQRMTMFFGTQHAMKSVTAAEAAALAAFSILDQGDRVGGIVFGDERTAEIRPKRNRASLHRFLSVLAEANGALRSDAPLVAPLPFSRVLRSVLRIARKDHLILVLSDFDGIDAEAEMLVSGLSRHNDLVLLPVTDPSADEVPTGLRLVVSDGVVQAELDTAEGEAHRALSAMVTGRLAEVFAWQRRFGVPVLPLSAGQETLPQLRRLMGLGPR
ncbi:MAG: DUF58 domain-containing protein [Pseudomonadota bacterium]